MPSFRFVLIKNIVVYLRCFVCCRPASFRSGAFRSVAALVLLVFAILMINADKLKKSVYVHYLVAGFSIKLLDNLTLIPQYVCQAYHNGSGRFDRRTYDDHVIYMTFQIKL